MSSKGQLRNSVLVITNHVTSPVPSSDHSFIISLRQCLTQVDAKKISVEWTELPACFLWSLRLFYLSFSAFGKPQLTSVLPGHAACLLKASRPFKLYSSALSIPFLGYYFGVPLMECSPYILLKRLSKNKKTVVCRVGRLNFLLLILSVAITLVREEVLVGSGCGSGLRLERGSLSIIDNQSLETCSEDPWSDWLACKQYFLTSYLKLY